MSNLNHRPKITVEDLLRLKRAERPPVEFWGDFERELRQKQLTALLEKRAWWRELPQFLVRRAYIPVGATAILAFTLVSVKYYLPPQIAQIEAPSVTAPNRVTETIASSSASIAIPVSSPLINRNETVTASTEDRGNLPAIMEESSATTHSANLLPVMLAPQEVESPSARSIAANLARLEQSEPELVSAFNGSRLSSPVRVQTAALGELASVPTNSAKRNRLLAQYGDRSLSPEPTAPVIVRERLAQRLGDSDMTDRISRLGLRGNQVSLRF